MRPRSWMAVLACLAVGLSAALAGCGGDSTPTVKVVSDLPLQGESGEQNMQMAWAIEHVIEARYGSKAGRYRIEFRSMDNSTKARGTWDARTCVENAHSHVSDEAIVGVIGAANSGCSAYEIPILNQGQVAMVSPADTAIGFTSQPERYYPSGERNFFRVVPSDDHQGRAGATFLKSRGVRTVYVLDDQGLYGKGVADAFVDAFTSNARKGGRKIVAREGWDGGHGTDPALVARIKASGAEGIYVGGSFATFGRRLIDEILRNTEDVTLLVSDGLVSSSLFGERSSLGGMFGTFPATKPTVSGERLKNALIRAEPDTHVDPYMVYAAAAAEVLLDAICRSDGSREDVIAKLFKTKLNTVVGPMRFDRNGDKAKVGRRDYAVYQVREGAWTLYRPRPRLTRAARLDPVQEGQGCLKPVGPQS
jgi:branched-chain amino acid transport system substrate-binding protein